ncbi:monocarboxylate transporter 14-like isoform X2 [Haliotis rufescens]|uniref:monocarboxylate transporter 14-like isoform X2 n=1 Tax=Haliotis rufescens TaxID=6454 RepID=UPI00201EB50A|nr:monocarboxylate transporter 14-like isoform X2 [Haliotis rufescens]
MSDNGVVENIKTTQDTPEDEKEAHVQDLLSKKGHISEDADSGLGWIIVFASFVNHVMFFGINLSFGVIYVVLLDYFDTKRGDTAWIGSIPTGILGIVAPVTGILTDKYGCRTVTMSGSVIASSGFVISSFAPNIDILYISYGVLVGIGLGLMYLPSKVIVNQYMKKRRSLANGICSSGGGVGTMAFAAMFQTLNAAYGFRGMFLISGAVVLNAAVCGALYRPKKQGHRKTPPLLDGASELQIKDKVCCKISPIQGYTHLLHNIQYCVWTGLKTVALVDVVGLENLGKALGLMMFAQGFSGFISSPLAGWLYDVTGTYAASFYTAGALFICGGIMVLSQMKLRNVCKQRGSDGVDVKFTVVSVVDP